MLKKLISFVLLCNLNLNAQEAVTNQADSTLAANNLAEKISQLRTYQAEFEQRVNNEAGKEIDFSSGVFLIEKPNHFRWQINQPYEQLIVADGDHIFTHDPDLEQVTIQNQSQLVADSPLLFLTSNAQELQSSFDITQIELAEKKDGFLFYLKPKGDGGVFESVHILFEKNTMKELLMQDTLGQQTSVQFSNIQINQKLEPSLFSFVIPEGIDVVDSRERIIE